jgi:hypothetical protein
MFIWVLIAYGMIVTITMNNSWVLTEKTVDDLEELVQKLIDTHTNPRIKVRALSIYRYKSIPKYSCVPTNVTSVKVESIRI